MCLKHEFYQDGEKVFTHRKCVNSDKFRFYHIFGKKFGDKQQFTKKRTTKFYKFFVVANLYSMKMLLF